MGLGSQDYCSRRCVESPRPRTGVSEQRPLPHARAFVECALWCAVRGWVLLCTAPASLPRSQVLPRRAVASRLAFSLPTSTSSARGVVQFWLTRRPTPAAIYGHRHPGGVSGLALSSLLVSYSPTLSVLLFASQSHHSRCASTATAFRFDLHDLYHTPKDTRPGFTS